MSVVFDISGEFDLGCLPPFLRVLLTTDGTVTNTLEAYFWEQVAVETMSQSKITLQEDLATLGSRRGDKVVSRHVQLCGLESGQRYVQAHSLIRFELLSHDFQQDLANQKLGIGELLRECGLETYREILSLGYDTGRKHVWRTYRIVMDDKPFIQIEEHFPICAYES